MIEEIQKPTAEPSDRNGITEELVAIIKAELRLPDLSLEDNLQDKGMDSLDANRIAAAFLNIKSCPYPCTRCFSTARLVSSSSTQLSDSRCRLRCPATEQPKGIKE